MGSIDNAGLAGSAQMRDAMSERDRSMPAATAAVVGDTKPSVQERDIGENARKKLQDFPEQNKRMRSHLERKRSESGHARDRR